MLLVFYVALIPSLLIGGVASTPNNTGVLWCYRKEECRSLLSQVGREQLTPAVVARVLSMMACSPTGDQQQVPNFYIYIFFI
jgi:hypothetical protein